jgi:hypothetical protein
MGECVIVTLKVRRLYSKKMRRAAALARMLPIFDFSWEENDELVKIEGAQIHYVASQTY